MGRLPGTPGLYVAVTHSGVTLAAHLARLIGADLISADLAGPDLTLGISSVELAPYRPDRFQAGLAVF